MASQLFWNNVFGFSLKSLGSTALLHYPASHHVKDVIIFRNELRVFLLSALHLSGSANLFLPQCFFALFIIHFLQLQQKRALAKEEFCSMSQKRSYLSAAWLHLRKVILWSSTLKTDKALSPGLQNLQSKYWHRSFQFESSSDTYPTLPILSRQSVLQEI